MKRRIVRRKEELNGKGGSWSQKEELSGVRRNLMGREMMKRRDRRWMLVRRRRVREMWVMIKTKLRAEIQRKQSMKGVKTMRRARIRRKSRKEMIKTKLRAE